MIAATAPKMVTMTAAATAIFIFVFFDAPCFVDSAYSN